MPSRRSVWPSSSQTAWTRPTGSSSQGERQSGPGRSGRRALWLGQCTAPAIEMDPHCTPASGRISAAASFRALDVLIGATLRRRRVVPLRTFRKIPLSARRSRDLSGRLSRYQSKPERIAVLLPSRKVEPKRKIDAPELARFISLGRARRGVTIGRPAFAETGVDKFAVGLASTIRGLTIRFRRLRQLPTL